MIRLEELQRNFKHYILDDDSLISNHIVATEEVGNDVRLSLYANAYYARLVEALETDYPALSALLGVDAFIELSHEYIKHYPSRFFTLRWFGQYMEQFLRKHKQFSEAKHLAEVARLEWTFINSFDAADQEVLDEADVATVPPQAWPALKVSFHPSVKIVENEWNSMPLWRAAKDNKDIPEVEKLPVPDSYLIWRNSVTTQYRYLEKDEAMALQLVMQGYSFVAMCEALSAQANDESEVPMRAAGLLKAWLAAGLITGLNYN